jgi:hypothetical protein
MVDCPLDLYNEIIVRETTLGRLILVIFLLCSPIIFMFFFSNPILSEGPRKMLVPGFLGMCFLKYRFFTRKTFLKK